MWWEEQFAFLKMIKIYPTQAKLQTQPMSLNKEIFICHTFWNICHNVCSDQIVFVSITIKKKYCLWTNVPLKGV